MWGENIGPAWVQFNVGYYLIAIVFLVFEVETVFLFPCAVVLKSIGTLALIEVGIFVGILVLALIYAWRKGVLEWV
jgi:NAD(P)H-quinone oxidoreductase subunit 3